MFLGAGSSGSAGRTNGLTLLLSQSKSLSSEPLRKWKGLGKLLGWEGWGCYGTQLVLPGSAVCVPLELSVQLQ